MFFFSGIGERGVVEVDMGEVMVVAGVEEVMVVAETRDRFRRNLLLLHL